MAAVDFLTAEMANKAHIDAVNRDYICEPHLGAWQGAAQPGDGACCRAWAAVAGAVLALRALELLLLLLLSLHQAVVAEGAPFCALLGLPRQGA